MEPGRNEPCPCGSGRKYKSCCAVNRSRSNWLGMAAVIGFVAIAGWAVWIGVRDSRVVPDGMVWDPEHGHYHRLPGAEPEIRPEGIPLDAEWSSEHGHYHDANGEEIDVGFGDLR